MLNSRSILHHRSLSLFIVLFSISCASVATNDQNTADTDATVIEQGFVEDQPVEPVKGDDSFFHESNRQGDLFRVLITDTNYSVRQYGQTSSILRSEDSRGDREQLKAYQDVRDTINFRNWSIEGVLDLRLNPHTGRIEQLQYGDQNPSTFQAAKLFQEDLTRFRFKFPQTVVQPLRFNVRFRWVITRRAGLTDEEAKAEAIKYLKSQTR